VAIFLCSEDAGFLLHYSAVLCVDFSAINAFEGLYVSRACFLAQRNFS